MSDEYEYVNQFKQSISTEIPIALDNIKRKGIDLQDTYKSWQKHKDDIFGVHWVKTAVGEDSHGGDYECRLTNEGIYSLFFTNKAGDPTVITIKPTDLGEFRGLNTIGDGRDPEAFMEDILNWGLMQLREF